MHKCEVLKDRAGSLKVKRTATGDYKKYENCLHCKGMFLKAELWRHMRRCPSKPDRPPRQEESTWLSSSG